MPTSSLAAQVGRRRAQLLGNTQEDVVGFRQLYKAGVPRWLVHRELRVGRWKRRGNQTLTLHNGPLGVAAQRWLAVLELGPRAALAGVSALQHHGVDALTDELIHVIVPRGTRPRKLPGVVVHESRRWREEDILTTGLRRTRPAVSAVHAGLWATTERQATYFVLLVVQQGLCRPLDVANALATVRRGRWRPAMLLAVADLVDGVRSLGELDVGRAMRRRCLPEPSRQVVRKRPSGTEYVDAEFEEFLVALEIDGAQHDLPWARLDDLVRDLGQLADGRVTVRVPLVAWRVGEDRILDALEALFVSRGWQRPAA